MPWAGQVTILYASVRATNCIWRRMTYEPYGPNLVGKTNYGLSWCNLSPKAKCPPGASVNPPPLKVICPLRRITHKGYIVDVAPVPLLYIALAMCNGQKPDELIFRIPKMRRQPLWLLWLVPGARLNIRALSSLTVTTIRGCYIFPQVTSWWHLNEAPPPNVTMTIICEHPLRATLAKIREFVASFCYWHPVNRDSTCSFVRRESVLYLALHELCNLQDYGQSVCHNILSFRCTFRETSNPVHRIS